MADPYNEPFFWHRIVNVGWGGGWGILAIDIPQNQDLSNPHGFFPIGPFSVGEHITPVTFFDDGSGHVDKDNWIWFAQIPPLPPILETLYDVITAPTRDRWFLDAYINVAADRTEDQEADLQTQTAELNAAMGYAFTEDSVGAYIRVDSGTTDPPDNTWVDTGDYPLPQTIYAKLYGSRAERQWRYWYRYLPTDPVHAIRKAVRLTYILNFAGGPPAFAEPEPFLNGPDQADEHLPEYNMTFKLDIYRRGVVFEVKETTIEGPEADRIYSQTRVIPYTQAGTIVTIGKNGFV